MNTWITLIKRAFRRLTPIEVAARELAVAELSKLEAQSAVEYAQSVVTYNDARIKRLKKMLADAEGAA